MKVLGFKAAAVIAVGLLSGSTARADVEFSERGAVGYLTSHYLRPGDAITVRQFLDSPRAQPLRIIYLDSMGGNPRVAMNIGRLIRERGIDTGFNPAHARCISACTAIFLGGVHRYYVGGAGVRDGAATRVGLGFHPPKNPRPGHEEMVNDYYREMGAPGASNLRYRIYPRESLDEPFYGPRKRTLYFVGSRTAVRAGVATGTAVPPGLRDY